MPAHSLPSDPLAVLLRWYVDAGLIDVTSAVACDHMAPLRPSAAPEAPGATAAPQPALQSPEPGAAIVSAATRVAAAARTLAELKEALGDFEGCALRHTATNMVFADGNPQADLMLVGEAPGRDEDLRGLPFVGRSGQLLDRMLAAIGRDRTGVYIINILPWRPPANRNPTPEEMAICMPFVLRHIELANPKLLVALGGVAAKQLLATTEGIMRLRGRWQRFSLPNGNVLPLLPTFHPAYLLRQPAHKRLAWRDLMAARETLEGSGTA